jgi:hypothetical protein
MMTTVAEIHRATVTIRQAPIIQQLEQDVEDLE